MRRLENLEGGLVQELITNELKNREEKAEETWARHSDEVKANDTRGKKVLHGKRVETSVIPQKKKERNRAVVEAGGRLDSTPDSVQGRRESRGLRDPDYKSPSYAWEGGTGNNSQ